MPEYAYWAYQGPASRIAGRLSAESETAAAQALMQKGLQPVEIKAIRSPRRFPLGLSVRRRLGSRDRALLARQLADLTSSGMPMLDALILLESQSEGQRLRDALLVMQGAVRAGRPLSEAMESLPRDFSRVHVNLARAGEGTGLLPIVLAEMAALDEREYELRAKVKAALVYPTITAVVGLLTILVILNFVVPRLSSIFEEMHQTLPLVTRVLLFVSRIARSFWRYGLVLILVVALLLSLLRRSRRSSLLRDKLSLRLPGVGRLVLAMQLARFTGILAALLRNGVPMVPALRATADTMDNQILRAALSRVVGRVNEGSNLGSALERERVFPRIQAGMISVGERTGNLEATLARLSESGGREMERNVRTLVALVEPALIILMGIFVAFIVAAVIIPIFQVNLSL
jgi:general secretion pathway protein F